jgi:hypothetical protein
MGLMRKPDMDGDLVGLDNVGFWIGNLIKQLLTVL